MNEQVDQGHLRTPPGRLFRKYLYSIVALASEDAEYAGRFLRAIAEVARKEGLDDSARGFRLVANTGPEGGQVVYHLHLHFLAGRRDERKVERR